VHRTMKWPILFAAFLASCWVLPGCPQATPSGGGLAPAPNDFSGADVPPSQVTDGTANAEPIDPKTDPRGIGGGTSGTEGTGTGEEVRVSDEMLGFGPLEVKPMVDARLRYGTDSKLLAKSPAVPYVVRAKSATITLSFSAELNWDPGLADQYWLPLTDNFDSKPQLRAVYVPPGLHQHVLYSDAEWTADPGGGVTYSLSDLSVADGGEIFLFMKEKKTADYHSGALAALDSDDAAKPFPSDPTAAIYPVGSFQMKAMILSTSPDPVTRQNDGQWLPLKF